MVSKEKLKCKKCQCRLEDSEVFFSYLDRQFTYIVPRCPICGQVYISEELVETRIAQLERALEEK